MVRLQLVASVSFSMFADGYCQFLLIPILPDFISKVGISSGAAGTIQAMFEWGSILGTLLLAYFSNFKRKKLLFVLGMNFMILSTIAIAFYPSYMVLLVGRFFHGLSSACVWNLGLVFVSSHQESQKYLPSILGCYSLGVLAASVLSGFLYSLNVSLPFIVLVTIGFVDLTLRAFLFEFQGDLSPQVSGISLRENCKHVASNFRLVYVTIISFAVALELGAMELALALAFESIYRLQPVQIGLCFVFIQISIVIFTNLGGLIHSRAGFRLPLFVCSTAGAGVLFLAWFRLELAWFVFVFVIFAGLQSTIYACLLPEMLKVSFEDTLGIVCALFNISWSSGLMIGPVCSGFLLQTTQFGIFALLMCSGSICFAISVLLYAEIKEGYDLLALRGTLDDALPINMEHI